MGKAPVIEEKSAQAEAAVVTCQHHWVIETPRGSMSLGRCKRCGEEREFRNSATDHLWEDDSGGGYNAWRGVKPARGASDDDEVAASRRSGDARALIA
jgi:hypothetical protein